MAASRAAKQAYLSALMFAPAPSFPGAEFGLAAPVILPQQLPVSPYSTAGSCRSAALSNTFDLAAAFGGAAPVPMPTARRDNVPPGLASLLQAAEVAQNGGRAPPRIDNSLQQHTPINGGASAGPSASLSWIESDFSAGSSSAMPAGVPNFLSFLQESGSMLNLANSSMAPAFGVNQSLALQQLVLLQHWIPILDRMAPVHKNLLWDTCKTFPGFRLTTPKLTSFRKIVTAWGANIAVYMPNVSALFAAIGYLKHHDILKSEFYFPDTQQPVFRTFVPSTPAPAPAALRSSPSLSSFKRPSSHLIVAPSPPPASSPPAGACAGSAAASASPPLSPSVAPPLSPVPQDDRGRDRSPDLEEAPAPQIKRSRVMTIATLTDSNFGN